MMRATVSFMLEQRTRGSVMLRPVRIAFTGTHRSGKSTLIERLAERLPRYLGVDEPYCLLEEEGYESASPPSIDDFAAQLDRSIASLQEGDADVLFDRCPVDILAYLLSHEDAASFDADEHQERIAAAMKTLDLIVFVPIESRDRIPVPSHEDHELRLAVHDKIEELLLEAGLAHGVEVLQIDGDVSARVQQVMRRVAAAGR
jgi:predicted ATPase